MSITFKSPSDVAAEYLTHLKGLKPEVNTDQVDSDWYIRSRTIGGVASGLYADQAKVSNDAFPQSARHDAIAAHLQTYFNAGFNAATQAEGPVTGTGSSGSFAAAGDLEYVYLPNGNTYQSTEDVTISVSGTYSVNVQSVGKGQKQNLLAGTILKLSAPPAGFNTAANVSGDDPIADGRDDETDEEASQRVLTRLRNPIAGGTASDYEQWAKAADASVVSANVVRWLYGLGTVGIVITAGTTDIDTALDQGDAIVLTPSSDLIAKVQTYIDTKRPVTDCAHVLGATELPIDVTVKVTYASGNGSTVLSGQTLTQNQLVQREVKRALYKTGVGGRKVNNVGSVYASDIEDVIDIGLSDMPNVTGKIPILVDRQVSDLSVTGSNRLISGNQVPVPGTITVTEV